MTRIWTGLVVGVLTVLGTGSVRASEMPAAGGTAAPASILDDLELTQAQPPRPTTGQPQPPTTTPAAPRPPLTLTTPSPDIGSTRLSGLTSTLTPEMAGDFFLGRSGFRPLVSRAGLVLKGIHVPGGSRGLKISDNESPRPQDRVYVVFNYFDDQNKVLNRNLGEDSHFDEYRPTLGVEITCLEGCASVGLRLPVHNIHATSDVPIVQGTDTDVGDLSVLFKYALCNDCETGDVLSVGLLVSTPTGTSDDNPFHGVTLQPWVGYIVNCGDWFLHGFSAVDVPVDGDDSTILFNDIGIGYRLFTNPDPCACLSSVIPMFEVHVNTPLNHRGALHTSDLAGTADTIDLTAAASFGLWDRGRLLVGAIAPVSGPRPFDFELVAALNWRF